MVVQVPSQADGESWAHVHQGKHLNQCYEWIYNDFRLTNPMLPASTMGWIKTRSVPGRALRHVRSSTLERQTA